MSNTTKGGVQRLDLDQITLNGSAATCTGAEITAVCSGNTATAAEITAVCSGNTATAAEINAVADRSSRIVEVTSSTLTLTAAAHSDRTVVVTRAGGSTLTLPGATKTGARFRITYNNASPSGSLIVKVTDATDILYGLALLSQDSADSSVMFETAADSDTITLNHTTSGGGRGCLIELEDIDSNVWLVRVTSSASGEEATPFSATVS